MTVDSVSLGEVSRDPSSPDNDVDAFAALLLMDSTDPFGAEAEPARDGDQVVETVEAALATVPVPVPSKSALEDWWGRSRAVDDPDDPAAVKSFVDGLPARLLRIGGCCGNVKEVLHPFNPVGDADSAIDDVCWLASEKLCDATTWFPERVRGLIFIGLTPIAFSKGQQAIVIVGALERRFASRSGPGHRYEGGLEEPPGGRITGSGGSPAARTAEGLVKHLANGIGKVLTGEAVPNGEGISRSFTSTTVWIPVRLDASLPDGFQGAARLVSMRVAPQPGERKVCSAESAVEGSTDTARSARPSDWRVVEGQVELTVGPTLTDFSFNQATGNRPVEPARPMPSDVVDRDLLHAVYSIVGEIGFVHGYNLASLLAFLTRGLSLLENLRDRDQNLEIRVEGPVEELSALPEPRGFEGVENDPLQGLGDRVRKVNANESWLPELEDELGRAEAVLAEAQLIAAELDASLANERQVRERMEQAQEGIRFSFSGFEERAERVSMSSSALMGRITTRLEGAQQAQRTAERRVTKRVVETESGIAGLLAGVGSGLAVVQLDVSAWWAYTAFWAVFAVAVLWIVSDLHYQRLHAIPPGLAVGGLVAALVHWLFGINGLTLGAWLVGSVAGYLCARVLLRNVGASARDNRREGLMNRVQEYLFKEVTRDDPLVEKARNGWRWLRRSWTRPRRGDHDRT